MALLLTKNGIEKGKKAPMKIGAFLVMNYTIFHFKSTVKEKDDFFLFILKEKSAF